LRATGGPEWDSLAETAVATGAFPIALASKALSRFAREYNSRKSASAVDPLDATSDVSLKPIWDLADDAEFRTLNVDGGVTNNSPLEAARLELAKLPPANPDVQDANHADRAVISIAPLTTSVPGKLPKFPDARITAIAGKIIAALVNQSRLQGEALNLTSDPRVATRWVISPTADGQTEPLASGLLGGFSGFFSKLFREHDYQLGRRNCQRFLTSYFGLPWTNPIVKQYGLSAKAQARLDAQYGFPAEYPSKDAQPVRFCPLIPVLPELRSEITVVRKPMDRKELADVLAMGFDRAKRVSKALLKESGYGTFSILAFTTSWPLIRAKIEGPLLDYVADELAKEDFVNQAKSNDMAQLIEEIRQLRGEITSVKKDLS